MKRLSRELSRYSVLGPATCRDPGKPPEPPATVKKSTVITRVGPNQRNTLPEQTEKRVNLTDQGADRVECREGINPVNPNRKVMVKHAAARRATRRRPLGEPLLVITTHAITSFRSSLPGLAGDQPRASAGSSPSRRHATRKSVDAVFCLDRHVKCIRHPALDQQPSRKTLRASFLTLSRLSATRSGPGPSGMSRPARRSSDRLAAQASIVAR